MSHAREGASDEVPRRYLGGLSRNVIALGAVSFFTDMSSEIIYPLLPLFLTTVLGAGAGTVGAIEGAAESTSALLKLASGWWSDRVARRKPLVLGGYALASLMRPLIAIAQSATQVLLIRVSDRVGKGIRGSPRDALIAESVDASVRGRAFGFHRAADHAGAVVGPLIAFAILRSRHIASLAPDARAVLLRHLFWLAAIPGVLSVLVIVFFVRDVPGDARSRSRVAVTRGGFGSRFWAVLAVMLLFTLGNSSDAFLLLRAAQLGVATALVPVLWAMLHVVKSASSTPGGILSDRHGRRPLIIAGWLVYAFVYVCFGVATREWQAWALFAVYGVYFGLTEGVQTALVADMVPVSRRGAAFGWYYLAIGLGSLPASLLFGLIWDHAGPAIAFFVGAAIALLAAVGIALVAPAGGGDPTPTTVPQQQREPGLS
ncbi:MAG: MFS transporter [Gemmatimonadota bacterium]|nr:MFS transporter [Gemmatimonadota bacterium]